MTFEWIVLLSLIVIGVISGAALIPQMVGVKGKVAGRQITSFNQTYLCKGTYIQTKLSSGNAEYANESSYYEDGGITVDKTGQNYTIASDIKDYYGWQPGSNQSGIQTPGTSGNGTQGTVDVPEDEYPDENVPTIEDNTDPKEDENPDGIYPTWKPTTPSLPGY